MTLVSVAVKITYWILYENKYKQNNSNYNKTACIFFEMWSIISTYRNKGNSLRRHAVLMVLPTSKELFSLINFLAHVKLSMMIYKYEI